MKDYILNIWEYNWKLEFWRYPNGRLAIIFKEIDTFNIIEVLTTNLVDIDCDNSHIFLNFNNNLNIDIVELFLKEKLIEKVEWYYKSGFIPYPKCKISEKLEKIILENISIQENNTSK